MRKKHPPLNLLKVIHRVLLQSAIDKLLLHLLHLLLLLLLLKTLTLSTFHHHPLNQKIQKMMKLHLGSQLFLLNGLDLDKLQKSVIFWFKKLTMVKTNEVEYLYSRYVIYLVFFVVLTTTLFVTQVNVGY